MEFCERERWAPQRRRLPTKVFATFAIFSISSDFSTTRRSARRAEKWKRVRVPVFVGLHSTLWFRPNDVTAYIEKITSDVMKVLVARARSSLFWESASTRRPFFPSTITFPSLMDRIVRAVSQRNAANVSQYLGDGYFRIDFRFWSMIYELRKKPKRLKIVRVLLKHSPKSTATYSSHRHLFFSLFNIFSHF